MTDINGTKVWAIQQTPFGITTINNDADINGIAVNNNFRFPGQYFDAETGLNYNYFRTYDATLGRYTQSDPIGLNGGLNVFGYVGGSPIGAVDRFGLASCFCKSEPGGDIDNVKFCFHRCRYIYIDDNSTEGTFTIIDLRPFEEGDYALCIGQTYDSTSNITSFPGFSFESEGFIGWWNDIQPFGYPNGFIDRVNVLIKHDQIINNK